MGEVDHEEDAVDERVAHGDEGVHAAQRDAGDEERLPGVDAVATGADGEDGADNGDSDDAAAEQPQEQGDEVQPGSAKSHALLRCSETGSM